MDFRLSSARIHLSAGLLVLLATLAPRTGVAAPPHSFTTLATPCLSSPTNLCLNDQRFKLEVQWKDFQGGTGVGQAVPLTSDTGYFWFFSSNNVELVVKVLDGRPLNGHFWVFFGALSNVEYTMRVTDSVTGSVKTYFNPSGRFASVGDTEAFSSAGKVSSSWHELAVIEGSMFASPFTPTDNPEQALPLVLHSTADDYAVAEASSTCVGTATSLCLNGGRFRLEVKWKDFQGGTGVGQAISLTSDTGYFWFFNSANVELVVKVLDARVLNNRFWVFYGALSNVEYEMTVTDTLTGNVNTYVNPSGTFASRGDTGAFPAGLSVAARLDQSRAVSSDIPTTGGTISATAANGTVFTLTVPPDALLSEERITMTPVDAVDGLPLSGGLSAAVELAPTGLRLFQLATLTIAPAAAIPIAEEITFAWRGTGEEFFLYPPELGTPTISMKLMHFGGYGVGRGSAADQAAQQLRPPASSEDALSQRLQDLFANRRRAQSLGLGSHAEDPADFYARVEAELRAYYNSVLANELEVARTNCERGKAIAPKALSWARSAQLIGLGETFAGEIDNIMSALVDALVNCYNESFDKCVDNHDPAQVQQMLSYARQAALLGADDRIDHDKIERCARFELHFESAVEVTALHFHQVRATVPIRMEGLGHFAGSAPLESLKVEYIGPSLAPCTSTINEGSAAFEVVKLTIDINVYEGAGPPPEPLIMLYDPGDPDFTWTISCPPEVPGFPQTFEGPNWFDAYGFNHVNEFLSANLIQARGWERVGGAVYARKTYQKASDFPETTFMDLKHTPQ
jgi:hypothetical protein